MENIYKVLIGVVIAIVSLLTALKSYKLEDDLEENEKKHMTADELRYYKKGFFRGKIAISYCWGSAITFIICIIYIVIKLTKIF